jgi:hypothetical protein
MVTLGAARSLHEAALQSATSGWRLSPAVVGVAPREGCIGAVRISQSYINAVVVLLPRGCSGIAAGGMAQRAPSTKE